MATTVDTLLVRIEADLSDLRRDLKKANAEAKKSSDGIAGSFKKIKVAAVAAVGVVVVRQLARAGMAAINLAADVEEMQSKSSVVFGQFRNETVAALDEFGNTVGRSTHELEGMASTIQDTFVPLGFARGEAAKLSVEMTKLAVDVASFNNASDVDTMRAFQSAIVGNHETVRRFGVIITEVTLNQELMAMGVAKGARAATEAQKVQARMNLITKGTSDAQGDAARTADSFTNSSKALRAEFEELVVKIGQELIPVAKELVGALRTGVGAIEKFMLATGMLTKEVTIDNLTDQLTRLNQEIKDFEDMGFFESLIFGEQFELRKRHIKHLTHLLNEMHDANSLDDIGEAPAKIKVEKEKKQIAVEFTKALASQASALRLVKAELSGLTPEMAKLLESAGLLSKVDFGNLTAENNVISIFGDDTDQTAKQIIQLREGAEALLDLQTVLDDQKDAAKLAEKALDEYNDSVEDGANFAKEFKISNQDLRDTITDITNAYNEGMIAEELYLEMMAKLKNEIASTTPIMETLNSAVSSMSTSISDSFADALLSGQNAMSGLKDAFKGFVRVMIAKAIELFFVNQILNAIFGGVTGFTKLPSAQLFGNKASGGAVQQGQPYMVGERGPEMFIPHSGGTIRNAADSKGGGGATTVINQSISIETGVSQTVRAEMTSILPTFKQETMNAIVDAKRRGGSFGQAMG